MNIKKLCEELDVRPSKKLGQNFLVHENTSKKILDWANIPEGSNVLEIGPGLGALTFELIERGYRVALVEKDKRLAEFLSQKIESKAQIHNADVLKFPLNELFDGEKFYIISNAPYSISSPILEKVLEFKDRILGMVFLFQEEVVDRIGAQSNNKNYGRLSIWIQCQCDIERGPRISKENFFPKPDVESRLVRITPSQKPLIPTDMQNDFLQWLSKIFQQRRKTLRKNLKDMGFSAEKIEHAFLQAEIPDQLRAEAIDIFTLFKIYQNL